MVKETLRTKEVSEKEPVPLLLMPERVLRSIAEEVLSHPDTETGGYLLGQSFEDRDYKRRIISSFDTFTPRNFCEIQRSGGHLVLGGTNSLDYYDWQKINWPSNYKDYLKKFGFDHDPKKESSKLRLLGIWHKHPGNFISPSSIDMSQVREHLSAGMQEFLFPIAVINRRPFLLRKIGGLAHQGAVSYKAEEDTLIDIVFYYMRKGNNRPLLLKPIFLRDEFFPPLSPNPWHIESPELLVEEIENLAEGNFQVMLSLFSPVNSREPGIWLCLEHPHLEGQAISIETSKNFNEQRAFRIKLGRPEDQSAPEIGTVVLEEDQTISDFIRPLIDLIGKKKG